METLEAYFAFTKSSSGGEIEESREEQYMDMKVALITFKKHESKYIWSMWCSDIKCTHVSHCSNLVSTMFLFKIYH